MIPAKEAVAKAVEFAGTVLKAEQAANVLVEEIYPEKVFGNDVWVITLSFPRPPLPIKDRVYKSFEVDRSTGEVRSMKIRSIVGL